MGDLERYADGLVRRHPRAIGRELQRLGNRAEVIACGIELEADLQAARVQGIAYVGKRAMQEVTMLSQLEVQLSALVPSATPRLQGIGDLTALAMADVVSDSVRKVR